MYKYCIIFLLALSAFGISAQDDIKKWTLDGYVSYMNTNGFDSIDNAWSFDNQIHNRLNFHYYPKDYWTISVQLRNRFIYGNSVSSFPGYAGFIERQKGFFNLNMNLIEEKSFLLNSNIDRLYVEWSKDKWEVQVGRQRINWGRTLVWNPNDIFNSYSYFDFDYVEKPGADALRAKYYPNFSSSIEIAAAANTDSSITIAANYMINKWGYDFQFIAGELQQKDAVLGFGYSGNIWNLGFKGEATYFMPYDVDSLENTLVATASLDYMIVSKLNVMAQILYSQIPDNSPINNFTDYYSADLNAKYLSFTEWNIFGQITYQITPLLTFSAGGMAFPEIDGFFLNPSLEYSLAENVGFSIFYQYFKGKFPNPVTQQIQLQQLNYLFLRMKWNF